jgi:hypothetical protein
MIDNNIRDFSTAVAPLYWGHNGLNREQKVSKVLKVQKIHPQFGTVWNCF